MNKLKTYEAATNQGFSFSPLIVGKNKRPVNVLFESGQYNPPINNRYSTQSKDIQEAIEKTKAFKIGIVRIVSETEVKPVNVKEQKQIKIIGTVTNYQQAAAYLHETFGESMEALQDVGYLEGFAKEKGVVFNNLKK